MCLGAVVLALVGTVSDLFAAVVFAREDKMDIIVTIYVSSAIQSALVLVLAPASAYRRADEPGLQPPVRSLRDSRAAFIARAGCCRRRDHLIRGPVAWRRLSPLRSR